MKVINITTYFIILMLSQVYLGNAQTKKLKVGDKMPSQLLEQLNISNSGISKPMIINFWATWCIPCIRELKLLDSVLKENDNLQVLSVTYEKPEKVDAFFAKNTELKDGSLTIISADTLLHSFFPHRTLPHNIWIDTGRVIKYVTGSETVKIENIQSFLNGREIEAKEKIDDLDFDVLKPFHLSDSKFISRSILTKRVDGILSGQTIQGVGFADKRVVDRVFCYNSNIRNILWVAVSQGISPLDFYNTMRIETNDSLRFFSPVHAPLAFAKSKYSSVQEWRSENTYCYELSLPKAINDTLFYAYMLDDLKRKLNIEIDVIEDSILCSIIACDTAHRAAPNPNDSTFIILNEHRLIAENISVISLFQFLNETVKEKPSATPIDPPFIDRTGGMRINMHIEFDGVMPKYNRIKEIIEEKYRIKIRHQKDKYKITIIKDMG